MMEQARAAAPAGTKVVAVTVLTSLDGQDLKSTGVSGEPSAQVERLAALARGAGLLSVPQRQPAAAPETDPQQAQ